MSKCLAGFLENVDGHADSSAHRNDDDEDDDSDDRNKDCHGEVEVSVLLLGIRDTAVLLLSAVHIILHGARWDTVLSALLSANRQRNK